MGSADNLGFAEVDHRPNGLMTVPLPALHCLQTFGEAPRTGLPDGSEEEKLLGTPPRVIPMGTLSVAPSGAAPAPSKSSGSADVQLLLESTECSLKADVMQTSVEPRTLQDAVLLGLVECGALTDVTNTIHVRTRAPVVSAPPIACIPHVNTSRTTCQPSRPVERAPRKHFLFR